MNTMPPIHLRGISNRGQFGEWLTRHGYTGTGVEVGTFSGDFAEPILSKWEGTLCCVDPWRHQPDEIYHDTANDCDLEAIYAVVQVRLGKFGERCRLLRMLSEEAAPLFKDGSLDFVYIDANHKREMAAQDIALWWPKVRHGGVLCGHDFYCWTDERANNNVLDAVIDFGLATGLRPHVTNCYSWWFIRP